MNSSVFAQPVSPRGRKPKLTPEVTAIIARGIREGLSYTDSCRLAGVGRTSFFKWRQRGISQARGRYRSLIEAIEAAEADLKRNHIRRIAEASERRERKRYIKTIAPDGRETAQMIQDETQGQWQASAWLLELSLIHI